MRDMSAQRSTPCRRMSIVYIYIYVESKKEKKYTTVRNISPCRFQTVAFYALAFLINRTVLSLESNTGNEKKPSYTYEAKSDILLAILLEINEKLSEH